MKKTTKEIIIMESITENGDNFRQTQKIEEKETLRAPVQGEEDR